MVSTPSGRMGYKYNAICDKKQEIGHSNLVLSEHLKYPIWLATLVICFHLLVLDRKRNTFFHFTTTNWHISFCFASWIIKQNHYGTLKCRSECLTINQTRWENDNFKEEKMWILSATNSRMDTISYLMFFTKLTHLVKLNWLIECNRLLYVSESKALNVLKFATNFWTIIDADSYHYRSRVVYEVMSCNIRRIFGKIMTKCDVSGSRKLCDNSWSVVLCKDKIRGNRDTVGFYLPTSVLNPALPAGPEIIDTPITCQVPVYTLVGDWQIWITLCQWTLVPCWDSNPQPMN